MLEQHIRAPGFLERQYICRNTNRYWTNLNIVAKYSNRLSEDTLSNALRQLCLEHSWLVLNFFRKPGYSREDDRLHNGTNFEVRPIDKVNFRDIVSFETIESLNDKLLDDLNELVCPMNVEKTLWRIIVYDVKDIDEQRVCVYYDHSLFDGVAGLNFHKLLIAELNRQSAQDSDLEFIGTLFDYEKDNSFVVVPQPRELSNRLFDPPWLYRVRNFLRQLWQQVSNVIPWFKTVDTLFSYQEVTSNVSAKYRMVEYSSDQVKGMLKRCKENGFTLTPYLTTVGLKAMESSIFQKLNFGEEMTTRACIPANARRFADAQKCEDGSTALGVYSGFELFTLKANISNVVATSKSLFEQLSRAIESMSCFYLVGMYKHKNIWGAYKSRLGKKEGRTTLVVSNLGVFDVRASSNHQVQKEPKWAVEDIWFSSCLGLVTHAVLNTVTTADGRLHLAFGFLPEYESYIDDYVDEFKRILEQEQQQQEEDS